MLKILFIHEVNYRKKVIFEMHEFPELLSLAGHDVDFLEFPEGTGIRNFSFRTKRRLISGRAYPNSTLTLITPPTIGGGLVDRILAPLTVLVQLRRLIKRGGYDVIFLYAVPTSGWQTVRIAAKFEVPVLFRALDVSHLIRQGPSSRIVKAAEKSVYKRATMVSANNKVLGDYVAELGERSDTPIINFPPLDIAHFASSSRREMRINLGIDQNSFVISYMGSLFTFSGLLQVVSDFAEVSEPTDRLVIIGTGDLEQDLKREVKTLGIEGKVIFTGVISYAELPNYLSISDVLINPFESTLVTNLALPHKVLQYMATGIPTVSTKLSGLYASLGELAGINWVDSPDLVVESCMELKHATQAKKMIAAELGKQFVDQHFRKDISLGKIEEAIRSLKRSKEFEKLTHSSLDVAIVVPTLGVRNDYLRQSLKSIRSSGAGLICIVAPSQLNLEKFEKDNLFDMRIDDDGDGLANAINKGFALLPEHIKFMSWLGDDDLIAVNALNVAREKMVSNSDTVAVIGICDYIGPGGEKILTNKLGQIGIKILSWGPDLLPQPGSLLRRSAFDEMGGLSTNYRMAFDLDMFLRLKKIGKIEFLDQRVSSFRWHPTSLTVSERRYAVQEASKIRRENYSNVVRSISFFWEPLILAFTLGLGAVVNWRRVGDLNPEDERVPNG